MSRLIVRGHDGREFKLVVTQFSSPMSATINSAQTRRMMNHFPIRAGQPDIQFTAHFTSQDDKHKFHDFVRDHQLNALDDRYTESATSGGGAVTLMWPERGIRSWSGYIVDVPVEEMRFDYAPKLTFGVMLVSSLMTKRTFGASMGSSAEAITGIVLSPYIPDAEDVSNWFQLPTLPASRQIRETVAAVRSVIEQIVTGADRTPGR